jgi:DNA-binding transcriptional LysR family regulator
VLAAQYALSGHGIALVDPNLFAEEIGAGRLVKPYGATLDTGYGHYLTTAPEGLSDTAIGLFRSWLIERFGRRAAEAHPAVKLAVSNE